jgi:hypothetical protein
MSTKNMQGFVSITQVVAAKWIATKVVPSDGVVVFVTDAGKFSIGDGRTKYVDLPSLNITGSLGYDGRIEADMTTGEPLWNGAPWPTSSANTTYIHTQSVLSDVWTIQHNKDKWPFGIIIFDENEEKINGFEDWDGSTSDRFILKFSEAVKGRALLRF